MRKNYQVDLEITVRPRGRGQFAAFQGGRLLAVSSEPLCAAARILLAEGHPPGTTLGMRHQGAPDIALRGRLGAAAKLTVRENKTAGPDFRRWEPFSSRRVAPPMRSGRSRVSDIGAEAAALTKGRAS
jgi:hypothetical protein